MLFILSTRRPMSTDAIAEQLKCFMAFEVQLILDWTDGLGLMEQMTPAAPKCVTEWWWLAVDAQRKRAEGTDAPLGVPDGNKDEGKRKGKGKADDAIVEHEDGFPAAESSA